MMTTPSLFWMAVSLTVQIVLQMMPQEVEGVFPLNNYRSRPPGGGVYHRHDLQQLKPLPELYGLVIVPQSSSDDDLASMAAAANGYNQPGLKLLSEGTRKRFPIFVGRRSEELNEEIDDWGKFEEDKRAGGHLFVGRKAPPIFVGKKAFIDLENLEANRRKKRSIIDQTLLTNVKNAPDFPHLSHHPSDASQIVPPAELLPLSKSNENNEKTTANDQITTDHHQSQAEENKRARLFVGKREESDVDEESKRSRMFVGKRTEGDAEEEDSKRSWMFVGRRSDSEIDGFSGRRLRGNLIDEENEFSERDDSDIWNDKDVPQKKSRMFVGKRPSEESSEDSNEWNKRTPKFVGKRLPKFVGKRAHKFVGKRFEDADFLKRSRMFVGKREDDEESSEDDETDLNDEMYNVKRSRMFVGKRAKDLETISKISPMFYFGKRLEDDDEEYLTEMESAESEDKRSRMFVGKRTDADFDDEDDKRAHKFVEKLPLASASNTLDNSYGEVVIENDSNDDAKRSRMFVGKKAAPGFIGKRPAPGFVGKRPAPGFVGKRPAPGFVGK